MLRRHPDKVPQILYPAINEKKYVLSQDFNETIETLLGKKDLTVKNTLIISSLNRYERKKNIKMAIESYSKFLKLMHGA